MKLYKFCYKASIIKLFILGLTLPILLSIIVHLLRLLIPDILSIGQTQSTFETIKLGKGGVIFAALIIAPIGETFLIQYLPLKLSELFRWKNKYNCILIMASAFLFGISHFFDIGYLFIMFFIGLAWAFLCFIMMRQKKNSFIIIVLIHAFYNGLGLLFG